MTDTLQHINGFDVNHKPIHGDCHHPGLVVNGNALNGALSPSNDSPTTPVSSNPLPNHKIDMDLQEQESHVRNEPLPIKMDMLDAPSALMQQESPLGPGL
jgi:hypothetical protein